MSTSLSAELKAEIAWSHENTQVHSTTRDQDVLRSVVVLAHGTGAGQADLLWHDRRTVSVAAPTDDIDLANSLVDVFGQALAFATIKAVLIHNLAAIAGEDIKIGDAGVSAWSAVYDGDTSAVTRLHAGGTWFVSAPNDGYTVTDGASDLLRIEHAGTGDVDYDIIVLGSSS